MAYLELWNVNCVSWNKLRFRNVLFMYTQRNAKELRTISKNKLIASQFFFVVLSQKNRKPDKKEFESFLFWGKLQHLLT